MFLKIINFEQRSSIVNLQKIIYFLDTYKPCKKVSLWPIVFLNEILIFVHCVKSIFQCFLNDKKIAFNCVNVTCDNKVAMTSLTWRNFPAILMNQTTIYSTFLLPFGKTMENVCIEECQINFEFLGDVIMFFKGDDKMISKIWRHSLKFWLTILLGKPCNKMLNIKLSN